MSAVETALHWITMGLAWLIAAWMLLSIAWVAALVARDRWRETPAQRAERNERAERGKRKERWLNGGR